MLEIHKDDPKGYDILVSLFKFRKNLILNIFFSSLIQS